MRFTFTGVQKYPDEEVPMSEDFFHEMELDESESSSSRVVYIKAIDLDEASTLGVMIPSDINLRPGMTLYALYAADGTGRRPGVR